MECTQAMAALRQMFGPVPPPKRVIVTRWGEDPFAYGSYSFVGVGATGAHFILWHVGSRAPALMATGSIAEGCSLRGTLLQPSLHTVAGSITYGGRFHHIRLQPPLHRVAGSVTYGCRRRLLDGGRASGHESLLCGRAHVRGAPGHRGAPATVCTGACNRVYCANRV